MTDDRRLWALEHAVRLLGADLLVEDLIAVADFLCGNPTQPSNPHVSEVLKFDPPSTITTDTTPTFNFAVPANRDPVAAAEEIKRRLQRAMGKTPDEVIKVPEESIEAAQQRLKQEEEQRAYRIAERQKDLEVIRAARTQACCKDEENVRVSTVDPEKVTEVREGLRRLVDLISVTGQVKVQQRDLRTLSTVLDELLGPIDG